MVAHPRLWGTALRQGARLAPRRWWRSRSHLPVPARAYLEFRLHTQYGDDRRPEPDDLVSYLSWCRAWNANRGMMA